MDVTTPITFVTGKGGVGKSMVAAGLALQSASKGYKTLLVEFGESSFYEKYFQVDSLKKPKLLKSNMYCVCLSAEECLRDYIAHFVKVKSLVSLFFNTKPMRALIKAAPALKELALLGQVTSHVRHHGPELQYDRIIIDSYATGHFLALMRAPYGMHEAVKFGPMGEQCVSLKKVIEDVSLVSVQVVTLLEEAPVAESLELTEQLKTEFGVTAQVVCNKKLWRESDKPSGESDFARYLTAKHMIQADSEAVLQSHNVQISGRVPYFFKTNNWELVESIAQALEAH